MRKPEEVKINVLNMNSGRARGGALEERGDSASSRPPPLAAGADVWRPVAVVRPGSGLRAPLSTAVRQSFLDICYSGVLIPEDADMELEEPEVAQLLEIDDAEDDDAEGDDEGEGDNSDDNDGVEARPILIDDYEDDDDDDDDEDEDDDHDDDAEGDDEGDDDNSGDEAHPAVVVIDDDNTDDDDIDADDVNGDGVYVV